MPWTRLDDAFYDHPKLDALGSSRLPCVGLFCLSLTWSNRFLTDGFIPAGRVQRLGGTIALAEKLVAAGLWERAGDGYRVHDFAEWNDSAQEVRARRHSLREWGKRGGLASGEARRLNRTVEAEASRSGPNSSPYHSIPTVPPQPDSAQKRFDEGVERTQREMRRIRGEGT